MPEGLHRTNFNAETVKFRSALELMETGKSAEQAMASLQVGCNVTEYPRKSAAHVAEKVLKTYFDLKHPITSKLDANEVVLIRRDGCHQTNPARVGYAVDDSCILHLRLTSIYGVNSREMLRDILLQAEISFP